MTDWRSLDLVEDDRGALVSIQGLIDIPFDIRRVYYLFGRPGSSRGFHAHKCLQQLMISVVGSCRVVLDDGSSRSEHRLDRPDRGLLLEAMTWREIHDFAEGTVLLVLASAHYDEGDYIRDYDEFLRQAGGESNRAR